MNKLYMETIEGTENLMVSEEWTCKYCTVPKGFIWDGSSVPVGIVIKRYAGSFRASLVHDYLCRVAIDKKGRKLADEAYRAVLEETGLIAPWRVKAGYWGVRVGAFFGIGVHYEHWTDVFRLDKEK